MAKKGRKNASYPELPTAPLQDLMMWWKSAKIRGAIFGGLAVALLSKPRATRDIDAVILLDDSKVKTFVDLGRRFGFRSRVPDPVRFANETRMVIVTHDASGIDVDLSLGMMPFEVESVDRARPIKVGRTTIPLISPEDLIIHKMVAHRSIVPSTGSMS